MAWTKERIAALKMPEVRQLRANAERLRELAVIALCDEVLGNRPKQTAPRKAKRQHELGVRADGTVVFTIWANEIAQDGNSCRYLLWAPNHDGRSPWSDKPGGKERLRHCSLL